LHKDIIKKNWFGEKLEIVSEQANKHPPHFVINNFKVTEADCSSLFKGHRPTLPLVEVSKHNINVDQVMNLNKLMGLKFCPHFKVIRGYVTEPLAQEERDFPIAFSIMVYKDVDMFERLFRVIYRPQNHYCVHIDLSSDRLVHNAVRSITSCFDNVHVPEKLIDVVHSEFSVLEAELACMDLLLKFTKWKYFINLTGQEFPLQTSLTIVKILKLFNGANNIAGSIKRMYRDRYESAPPLPVNVTLTKGSVHIVASRPFVDYVINNANAKLFLAWVNHTDIPEETFFSTLNHSPQLNVPGSYLGVPEILTDNYRFITRYKNWFGNGPDSYPCAGKYVRGICIFGVGDLPDLSSRPHLFANKFNVNFEPLAYDCLEELLHNRTRLELNGLDLFNVSIYDDLSFIKNHL